MTLCCLYLLYLPETRFADASHMKGNEHEMMSKTLVDCVRT
jgi:hypothetical protein